ncbi:MAG: serine/threonine-protein kinase RsbT [Pseudomonadota bacterium]|nr:serine/threonine-protein kinase RsbT [Pseudomonadota bacterium]
MHKVLSETWCIPISDEIHAAEARRDVLIMARRLGFGSTAAYHLAIAVTELAINICHHAGSGEICLRTITDQDRIGIEVIARDRGPGIADIELALRDGYSTWGSLGCGLSGVQRLLDELEIDSKAGQETRVRGCKWLTPPLNPAKITISREAL